MRAVYSNVLPWMVPLTREKGKIIQVSVDMHVTGVETRKIGMGPVCSATANTTAVLLEWLRSEATRTRSVI